MSRKTELQDSWIIFNMMTKIVIPVFLIWHIIKWLLFFKEYIFQIDYMWKGQV